MAGIIDYKSDGNIHAFKNAFRILNVPYIIADQPELLEDCNKIILPGVGSFDSAVKSLKNTGFYDYIQSTLALRSDKKLLGVCVGFRCSVRVVKKGGKMALVFLTPSLESLTRWNVQSSPTWVGTL